MENRKAVAFFRNTGMDPLENHKGTQQVFIVGHHQPANETPCEWCFAGGPVIARF